MLRHALLIASITLLPAVADAAPCAKRSDSLEYFLTKFYESPVSIGLTSDGKVLEILTSDQGTWTIIVTTPSGQSCGIVSGEAWSEVPTPKKQPGDAAS